MGGPSLKEPNTRALEGLAPYLCQGLSLPLDTDLDEAIRIHKARWSLFKFNADSIPIVLFF